MTERPYQIEADATRQLITIAFERTFWNVDVAERFRSECLAAVASLRCALGQHVILVDLRNAVLQSREVYERMQALVGSATALRIALVASTPLARMQTKRLQIRENVSMFGEVSDARAWLAGDDLQAA